MPVWLSPNAKEPFESEIVDFVRLIQIKGTLGAEEVIRRLEASNAHVQGVRDDVAEDDIRRLEGAELQGLRPRRVGARLVYPRRVDEEHGDVLVHDAGREQIETHEIEAARREREFGVVAVESGPTS